jgi:hypothetical protein
MYRRIFDRHAGDLYDLFCLTRFVPVKRFASSDRPPITGPPRLEYLESSRDAKTGEIRFRRHTFSCVDDPGVMSSALPMTRPPRALNEPYVERFVACEIRVEPLSARSEAHVTKIDPDMVL